MAIDRPDDARPSGYTIDGVPWEEPRGPHLPDGIIRQPVLVWPFLALAALIAGRDVIQIARLSPLSADDVLRTVLGAIPAVTTVLLGAAWFRRHPHPDLRSSMATAVTLLAVAAAMRLAAPWVLDTASSFAAADDDPFGSIRWSGAWSAVVGAVVVLADVAFVAAFRDARRRPADPRERPATIVVGAIAILTMVLEIWSTSRLITSAAGSGSTDDQTAILLSGLLLSLVFVVVTAAVAVQLLGGALAGEAPVFAWRLGAIGFLVDLGATTLAILAAVIGPQTEAFFVPFQWALVTIEAIGALALLAAILLGLPSDEPAPAEPDGDRR